MLTIEEAAAVLGVNPRTLRRYIRDGRVPAYAFSSQVVRLELGDLEKFMAESLRVETGTGTCYVPPLAKLGKRPGREPVQMPREAIEAHWRVEAEIADAEVEYEPVCIHPRVYGPGPREGLCTVCGEPDGPPKMREVEKPKRMTESTKDAWCSVEACTYLAVRNGRCWKHRDARWGNIVRRQAKLQGRPLPPTDAQRAKPSKAKVTEPGKAGCVDRRGHRFVIPRTFSDRAVCDRCGTIRLMEDESQATPTEEVVVARPKTPRTEEEWARWRAVEKIRNA